MKKCPFCTAEVPDEAAKCMHCGEWIDSATEVGEKQQTVNIRFPPTEFQQKAFKGVLVLVIIVGVGSVLIFLVFLFVFFLPLWNKMQQGFGP